MKLLLHLLTSLHGPSRRFAAAQQLGRFWREADISWQAEPAGLVANDPFRNYAKTFGIGIKAYRAGRATSAPVTVVPCCDPRALILLKKNGQESGKPSRCSTNRQIYKVAPAMSGESD